MIFVQNVHMKFIFFYCLNNITTMNKIPIEVEVEFSPVSDTIMVAYTCPIHLFSTTFSIMCSAVGSLDVEWLRMFSFLAASAPLGKETATATAHAAAQRGCAEHARPHRHRHRHRHRTPRACIRNSNEL